jgi:glyoxylase-like metal-dependent hydrolase (beta-lactamase superfamily II)
MPQSVKRRRWLIAGLTVVILAAAAAVGYVRHSADDDGPLTPARVPRLGAFPTKIISGVYLLGSLDPAAAYVVETSDGLVLIDAGLESDAALLKQDMAKLGLDWRRVRVILLTHVHGDHSGGAEQLRAATGAKVYVGAGDAAVLRAGRPREAFFSTFYVPEGTPTATTADVELHGDEVIEHGGVRFRALAAPGHTPGSMCYLMERKNLRVLFSGDVIMSLMGDESVRPELARPLGTYAAYLAPRYRGDARSFLSSLRALRALPVPDLVLPGHPRLDEAPQSPCLSQQRWDALLDAGIREMEALLARYERDGAGFLDGTPKKLLPDLYYLGEHEGSAVYGFFASSKFFIVATPGAPGLSGFLKDRLEQLGVKPAAPTAVLLTSCGPEATAGLREFVETTHAAVVASAAGLATVREACPTGTVVLSAEEAAKKGWFEVTPLGLRGRGVAPIAYVVRWAGRTVLFSGRMPVKADRAAVAGLLADLNESRGNATDYAASLRELSGVKPELWLPAVPVDGQNARLYDRDWDAIIAENRKLLR